MGDDLIAGVEQIRARDVIALLSDDRSDPDCAIEGFVLASATADP